MKRIRTKIFAVIGALTLGVPLARADAGWYWLEANRVVLEVEIECGMMLPVCTSQAYGRHGDYYLFESSIYANMPCSQFSGGCAMREDFIWTFQALAYFCYEQWLAWGGY